MRIADLKHIFFSYDEGHSFVIRDFSFSLDEGEHVALVGRNGAGKSTLGKLVAGLLSPDSGEVELMGLVCFDHLGVNSQNYEEARKSIAYVAQDPATQLVTATVAGELAFGPQNLCLSVEQIDELVALELDKAGLGEIAERDPMTLSGGEQQLVSIAAAIASEPRLVVLDEPTAFLDEQNEKRCMRLIEKISNECTVLHITHKPCEIAKANRVIEL